jgi:peptidyl-prolyl cis-trans isomerase D
MVKPFEDAVFAMKPARSATWSSPTSATTSSSSPACAVARRSRSTGARRDRVRGAQGLAQKKYAEAAEQFTNTVYEQYDSLQPVIDKLKLEKRTPPCARAGARRQRSAGVGEKLLGAVFGNEAVKNKRNTDAVEVGPNQLTSARVVKHEPARTLPLAEVKDRVRERRGGRAGRGAGAQGGAGPPGSAAEGRNAACRHGDRLARQPQGLPRAVLDAVLKADVDQGRCAVVGVDLVNRAMWSPACTRCCRANPRPAATQALQAQVAQAWAAAESEAYLATR